MSPAQEREPTRDQLLAMAWADGELAGPERADFERRLASEQALRREVAAHQELAVLARAAAPREPADHEWARLAREPVQKGAFLLGWLLLGIGVAGGLVFALWKLFSADLPPVLVLVLACLLGGIGLLFFAVLRAHLRTLPYDPYRKVER